jgi:hypothetical protein
MARMRGFARMWWSATAVVENSLKSALQLLQAKALSGEEALHFEQVCIEELQGLIINSVLSGRKQPDFTAFYFFIRTSAWIKENSSRLRWMQFEASFSCLCSYLCDGSVWSSVQSGSHQERV